MISYGDMLDVVETEEKKNAPATVVQLPKTEMKEEIEDVIEDGEKEEVEENEN